ncbi:MAG: phasin family protein [Methanosarcina sp.]|jgi:polyhydroxyalkanoate synthesis regulator phasin|nr:phasin family protein [Methanosarcina sp.]MDD3316593.1 phasin family protein [Methanosarcina sp.]MDD4307047.1 phasin family protein [Methanosarcina sp.]MDD4620182.1 phasin family protein [Methanosarcina sp.]NLN43962.1 phasin family protein [Methanosarcina sp.]
MRESVRKLGLIGAGLWAITEDKVNDLVKELVDKGDISKEEGKKVIQDMLEERKKQKIDLEKKISEKIQESISKAEIFTKKDVHELEFRIEALEEEIQRIKNKEKMFFK